MASTTVPMLAVVPAEALLFGLVVAALVVAGVVSWQQRQRETRDLGRLLTRQPELAVTVQPCGLSAADLAHSFVATPRGDRRCGIQHGVTGPLPVRIGDSDEQLECATLRWWWEVRRQTRNQHGTSTRYDRQRRSVTMLRLPGAVPDHIVIRPESLFGRAGLTRGGHQVESSEFNRRFRVEAQDRTLLMHLLDANLQQLLTEAFDGRSIELLGELLVIGGGPTHRDTSLTGVIGEIPALRQDAQRLVSAFPRAFWRAVAAAREG